MFEETTLGNVVSSIVGGGTPARIVSDYWNGLIPWASVKDFSDGQSFIQNTQEHITEKGLMNSASHLIKPNTVLICTRMAVGRAALTTQPTAINQDVKALYTNEKITPEYLLLLLNQNRPLLESMAIGSTVKGIVLSQLLDLKIKLPPPGLQPKIAAVLSSVDRAIEQTEKLIEKQKRIKRGLLHDLLTKGIDAGGAIRSEATHEFKDSPLGRIPKDWEVENVGNFLMKARGFVQTGPFGSQLHAHEYVAEGVPVIMPQDILGEEISTLDIAQITEDKANQLKRHKTKVNDVVFARRGDLSRIVAINEKTQGWLCGTGCLLMRVSKKYLNASWFAHIYRWQTTQTQVEATAVGSTMPNLNSQIITNLLVAFPSIEEQDLITGISSAREKEIKILERQRQKLKAVKKGLMQDLLTENAEARIGNL